MRYPVDNPCTYCDKTYNQKKELERHVLQIHEKREYCGKEFAIQSQVKRHVKLIHTDTFCVNCEICGKKLNTSSEHWMHKVFVHNETKDAWICEICPKRNRKAFKTPNMLEKHMNKYHSSDNIASRNNDVLIDLNEQPLMSVNSSKNTFQMLPKIGSGSEVVTLSYKSFSFGPINAKDDNEAQNIFKFFKYKIKELEYKVWQYGLSSFQGGGYKIGKIFA